MELLSQKFISCGLKIRIPASSRAKAMNILSIEIAMRPISRLTGPPPPATQIPNNTSTLLTCQKYKQSKAISTVFSLRCKSRDVNIRCISDVNIRLTPLKVNATLSGRNLLDGSGELDSRRMKLLRNAGAAVGLAGELLTFLATNKRWWLIPMLIVLFLFAAVTIAGQSSAISPFVYTLF
jgi:uncharacterized protein DUF5989